MQRRRDGYPSFVGSRFVPRVRGVQSDIPSQQAPNLLPYANADFQPDIDQMAQTRRAIAAKPLDSRGGWVDENDKRVPKVRMANKSVKIIAANTPQLIMRMNPYRSLFVIGNNTGVTITYTYGYPAFPNDGAPLTTRGTLTLSGLACPIDDVWVSCSLVGAIISAFEGAPVKA